MWVLSWEFFYMLNITNQFLAQLWNSSGKTRNFELTLKAICCKPVCARIHSVGFALLHLPSNTTKPQSICNSNNFRIFWKILDMNDTFSDQRNIQVTLGFCLCWPRWPLDLYPDRIETDRLGQQNSPTQKMTRWRVRNDNKQQLYTNSEKEIHGSRYIDPNIIYHKALWNEAKHIKPHLNDFGWYHAFDIPKSHVFSLLPLQHPQIQPSTNSYAWVFRHFPLKRMKTIISPANPKGWSLKTLWSTASCITGPSTRRAVPRRRCLHPENWLLNWSFRKAELNPSMYIYIYYIQINTKSKKCKTQY